MPFLILALAIGLAGLAGVASSDRPSPSPSRQASHSPHGDKARSDGPGGGDGPLAVKDTRRASVPGAERVVATARLVDEEGSAQEVAAFFDGARGRGGLVLSGAGGVGAAYATESFEQSRQAGLSLSEASKKQLRIPMVPLPKKGSRATASFERYHKAAEAAFSPFTSAFNSFQRQAYETLLPVVTRQDWGARKPTGRYAKQSKPYRITVHHTEGHRPADLKDSVAEAREIQAYHQKGRAQSGKDAFIDIGYHFLIDGEGRVIEGRPLSAIGAHAGDANAGNIGIALMGNMDHVPPTARQLDALRRLSLFVSVKYGADPHRTDFIEGHNHYVATACPGKHLGAQLPRIRRELSREYASIAPADTPLLASAR